jgi:DNA adenine methylase
MDDFPPEMQLPKPRPVVGWAGGKARLCKHIVPLIKPHTCYVEVFGGGLAVFLAKPPSAVEVINDINGDLVSFYRNCKLHLEAILEELDLVLNSRREFEDYIEQPGLTEIQRAARWFIRNKLSFSGSGNNFVITRTQPMSSRENRILAMRSLSRRLDRTTIEQRGWEKLFSSYDAAETMFFLDPPYPEAGVTYSGWDELTVERFCAAVRALSGQWVFTFKDCEQVRDCMAGYTFRTVDRARGINNTREKKQADRYQEIIITSERPKHAPLRKGKSA